MHILSISFVNRGCGCAYIYTLMNGVQRDLVSVCVREENSSEWATKTCLVSGNDRL